MVEDEAFRQDVLSRIPIVQLSQPTDIASAVVAVAGDSLGYLTGQTVHMNGGFYMA